MLWLRPSPTWCRWMLQTAMESGFFPAKMTDCRHRRLSVSTLRRKEIEELKFKGRKEAKATESRATSLERALRPLIAVFSKSKQRRA